MRFLRFSPAGLTALGAMFLLSMSAEALGQATQQDANFAAPVRIEAGEKLLGEGRLYPSPAFQDMNGDGKLDIVIGDLFGHVTVAHRLADAQGVAFGPETKVLNDKGKELKFNNW